MTEHKLIPTEDVGLPAGGLYVNLSDVSVPGFETQPTQAGQKAATEALEEIKNRSFSGRHPELGPMINCQFCGFRHRENQNGRSNAEPCQQKFASDIEIDGILVVVPERIAGQAEHTVPDNIVELEIPRKQRRIIFGAKSVKGRRKSPRKRPKSPLTYWQRILIAKAKREEDSLRKE